MNVLAVDIGGTKFSAALFSEGRMIKRKQRATDRDGGRDWMIEQIVSLARGWKKDVGFERCGIGFGGPVNFESQRVTLSIHVGSWQDCALAEVLASELGVSAIMDNDANTGALGEASHGAGVGYRSLFYMTLSTGIGGGVVINGQPYRGADSYAGEVGHICVNPGGPRCLCGAYGCLERMCSGLWLERDNQQSAGELLKDMRFMRHYVVDLARGLKNVVMLLNPERIVIGGGISKMGEALFAPLREELQCQSADWLQARIDVVPAQLGDDSVLYGALELANGI